MLEIIRYIFTFFFSRRGLETFWIPCTYWTFPIILMITFSRFENADNITRRIGNAKLVEVEGSLVEHDSSKYGGGGLYIYGKTVSLIDNGTLVQLKVVSAPSNLYEFANKQNKETIILFGRVIDQSLYPTKITNLNHEEYTALSSKEFNDKFIQLQEKAPKEAKQWGYLSIFWLILVFVCTFLKKEMNRKK
ncbi:hypothetical protein [Acinetobacter baumannii]|uniref:hypothetical protein n=1 Tax=Acinetobacter baumannii TaxID=470 RepID=UPI000FEC7C48|nr:hypothetical protein [Acinetobacter baumannii]MCR0075055.1 hypothetical protein [Acinetobacter baumannii]MDC4307995.1 hypothetical protein [Acinetobacter baumannii]MDC4311413.1 hypothetical protein [Acinetobacter baumannii]MDC4417895.1 hypothetical protein [Acinetobacter baumannii]QAB41166.1 hypothetical protein EHF38_12800 [Acinetobacter baumannii]